MEGEEELAFAKTREIWMNISNKELYELTFFGVTFGRDYFSKKMLLAFSWHLKIPSSGGQAMHQQVTWLLMAIEENGALFGCPSGIQQKMQNEDVDPKDPKQNFLAAKLEMLDVQAFFEGKMFEFWGDTPTSRNALIKNNLQSAAWYSWLFSKDCVWHVNVFVIVPRLSLVEYPWLTHNSYIIHQHG